MGRVEKQTPRHSHQRFSDNSFWQETSDVVRSSSFKLPDHSQSFSDGTHSVWSVSAVVRAVDTAQELWKNKNTWETVVWLQSHVPEVGVAITSLRSHNFARPVNSWKSVRVVNNTITVHASSDTDMDL